ncbi:hypothetical protein FisN_31Hu065 [Fistulifera solaris]|uniref:Uncharacterized protein n=1 Tax=Fistulifera solaris TaxID=1519565 RepID=A0A1Z5JA51_FISSO|nr:hypothetical protein FisN_31Hu065 [Fistulifera solaris]|eukprot:GAX10857.1 hypothetical protein FisN_31Hu065 [Fistulifera solaris]
MFKRITTLASIVLLAAVPSEGRRLFRIDTGDNQFSAEKNSVNSFESLLNEEDGRNVFRFLASNFGASMSFSMSMDYRMDLSPAVPRAPTPAPTIQVSTSGTPIFSHAPSIGSTAAPSKSPTDNPSEQPTISVKLTSTEESQLQVKTKESKKKNHRATLIGSLLAVGLAAMAFFIYRARRRGPFSIISSTGHGSIHFRF